MHRTKALEEARKEELELAKKAMALEAEMEANMTSEERRQLQREREEADAKAMADDLFGGVDDRKSAGGAGGPGGMMKSGDKVVMNDLKDHLRHAKKVGECIQVRTCSLFVINIVSLVQIFYRQEVILTIFLLIPLRYNNSIYLINKNFQFNDRVTGKSIFVQLFLRKSFNNAKMSLMTMPLPTLLNHAM